MLEIILLSILFICSYLIGSVNFAILLCSIAGYPDPRTQGSQNPGATNVLRVANRSLAALVLFCDGFKGFLPVYVASLVLGSDYWAAFVGLSAFLGHLYPIFFNFKGGKGVATFIGVILALYFPAAILFVLVWLIVAFITKYSSLGAIASTIGIPFYLIILGKIDILLPVILIGIILLIKHKDNFKRLKEGTESKINIGIKNKL